MKYKIKTEKEFISEFGPDWPNRVQYGWSLRHMTPLHGKYLPKETGKKIFDNTIEYSVRFEGWSISQDMVNKIPTGIQCFEKLKSLFKVSQGGAVGSSLGS